MAGQAGIRYSITGDVGPGLAALRGFQQSWGGMVSAFATGQAAFAAVRGAVNQVGAAFQGVRSAFDLGGTLSDMSTRTGIAVRDLTVLRKAFKDAGIGADSVGPIVNVMQRSLAGISESGESTAAVFAALGLSMDSLRSMSTSDQLTKIGSAINGLADPAQRSAVAMKIFGRSGGEMLTLFADDGAMKAASQTLGRQADILGRQAGNFDRISDLMGSVGEKMQGLFVGVADKMAGPLLSVLESLNKIDLSGIGQQIGDVIARMMRAFQQGKIGELLGESIRVGLAKAGNFAMGMISGIGAAFPKAMDAGFSLLKGYFKMLINPDLWIGLGKTIMGVFYRVGVELIRVFQGAVGVLKAGVEKTLQEFMGVLGKIPKLNKWLGLEGFKAESFEAIFERSKSGILGFSSELLGQMSSQAEGLLGSGAAAVADASKVAIDAAVNGAMSIVDGFKQGFAGAKPVFDDSAEKLSKIWNKDLSGPKGKAAQSPATTTAARPAGPTSINLGSAPGKGGGAAAAGESGSTNWKDIFQSSIKEAALGGEVLTSDRRSELMKSAVDLAKKNRRIGKAREKYGVDSPAEGAATAAAASPAAGAAAATASGSSGSGGVERLLGDILKRLEAMAGTLQEATA